MKFSEWREDVDARTVIRTILLPIGLPIAGIGYVLGALWSAFVLGWKAGL